MRHNSLWMAVLLAAGALGACGGDDSGDKAGEACSGDNPFGNQCGGSGKGGAGFGNPDGSVGPGSGTGGSGRPGSGPGRGPGDDCAGTTVFASRVTPTIHLVVDGSCSMELDLTSQEPYGTCDIESPGPLTRWGALREALVSEPDGVVTRLDGVIRFGLFLYGTDPTCPLIGSAIAPAVNQAAAIRAALPLSPPGSNTPTGMALQQVADGITPNSDPDQDLGPQIVLLATDGAPNSCDSSTIDFQPSLQAAMATRAKQVTMYVLSLAEPSGEYGAHLQEMADIGLGVAAAPLYSPSNPQELRSDLEALIGGAVGCDATIEGTVDPSRVCEGEVLMNGEPLECGTDFELVDSSTLRLLGATCDQFKNNPTAMLTARWPCDVYSVD